MRNMFTRCAAAAAAAVLTLSFSSCGGKDSSSDNNSGKEIVSDIGDDVNIAADDMPYGACIFRMEQGENGIPVTTEVDSRFYSEEEAKLICNYFWAISSKDGALFDSVSYKPYNDEMLKSGGYSSSQEYMEAYYDKYYIVIGTDYEFSYIYAVDCKKEDSGYNFSKYDDIIKEVAPDAEITSKKVVPVYLNYEAKDGSSSGEVIPRDTYDFPMGAELGDSNYIWICLYEIDGKSYIIS
ncbi:MAG: hypothetical protein GXY08_12900 [Ruminococcus sp.]|nr:hypothetical protein [Ruminococcus sp.]